MAVSAGTAASSPCPNPSTTATRAPPGKCITACRSPDLDCPGSVSAAAPHSMREVSTLPFLNRHDRAQANIGDDFKLVHQPPDSGQAKPQTPRRREPGLEGAGNVWDTRSFVVGRDNDPAGFSLLDEFQDDFAALGVEQNVSSQLGNCGGDS